MNNTADCDCFLHQRSINRRSFLGSSALFVLSCTPALSQEPIAQSGESFCTFSDGPGSAETAFASTAEARGIVQRIVDAVGLVPNFQVFEANVPNAAARIRGREREILYNQSFIADVVLRASTSWAGLAVVAHEVGHHLNGHTLCATGSRPPIELEADRFAGFVVRELGGTLQQAQALFHTLPAGGSSTHPPRQARLEAVREGWTQAATPRPGEPHDLPINEVRIAFWRTYEARVQFTNLGAGHLEVYENCGGCFGIEPRGGMLAPGETRVMTLNNGPTHIRALNANVRYVFTDLGGNGVTRSAC